MGKTLKYVKEFDFNTKACNYETGGMVKPAYAKGGKVTEKATGETYPSRKAMEKHEKEETPRMQREELIQKATIKGAIPRRSVPVAPAGPLIAMKKGGYSPKPVKKMASGGAVDKSVPSENTFRVTDGKYLYNNEEVSKEQFDRRKAEVDSAVRSMRGSSSSERTKPRSMEERKASAFSDLEMKKGGAVPKAGAFKIPKVMNEFKEGKLHSGSKTGPEVTDKKQAMAIALSEARRAGKR